jgi:hypothetical protein
MSSPSISANGEKLIANPAIALDAITRTQATFTTRDLAIFARGGRADLMLGLEIDALRFQAAVIDPCIDVELGEVCPSPMPMSCSPFAR